MESKDRLIMDLYNLRAYLLRHKTFRPIAENLSIMGEFNDLLYGLEGLNLPYDGIIINKDEFEKKLNVFNRRSSKEYFSKVVSNNEINEETFYNYLKMHTEMNPNKAFFFLNNLRTFSLKESTDLIMDFFSKCDKDSIDIVSKYLDKSRIVLNYDFSLEDDLGDTSGLFRYSNLLNDGFIILDKDRLSLFDISTIVHELGHAIERERFIGPQMKKISLADCIGLEAPSMFYEIKFMDYLLDRNLLPRESLLIYNRYYNLISRYCRNYLTIASSDQKTVLNTSGDLIYQGNDGKYYVYNLCDSVCYGMDGVLSLHLRELEMKDPKKFKILFNDFICSRKEKSFQERITSLGFDLDEYKSCDIIKPRMLEIVNKTNKKIYNM